MHFLKRASGRAENRDPIGLGAADGEVQLRNSEQRRRRIYLDGAATKASGRIERKLSNSVRNLEEIADVRVAVTERLDPRDCYLRLASPLTSTSIINAQSDPALTQQGRSPSAGEAAKV